MTSASFSAQTINVPNPFTPYGKARLAAGAMATLVSGWCLYRIQPLLLNAPNPRQTAESKVFAFVCGFFLIWGLVCLAAGIKWLGRLVVPSRTPADLKDPRVLATVLVRREFPHLRLPETGPVSWIQRYFTKRVIYGTPRDLSLLEQSVRSIQLVVLLAVPAVIVLLSLPRTVSPIASSVIVGALPFLVLGVVRAIAIPLLLPKVAPDANRFEATRLVRGGGDPSLIQPLVEKEFLALRVGDIPNRPMGNVLPSKGPVADTGTFTGYVTIETQPLSEPIIGSPLTWLYLGSGLACTAIAMILMLTGVGAGTPGVMGGSALVAALWWIPAGQLLVSGGVSVGRFRYRSTIMLLQMEGALGRSEVKAGKALTDSFESANLVVRSDSTLRVFAASVVSETYTLDGERVIVWAEPTPAAEQAMQAAGRAIDHFEGAGIVVRPIETDAGFDHTAQVNLAYRKAVADIAAGHVAAAEISHERAMSGGPNLLPPSSASGSTHAALSPADATKDCPMCAETIKAAARKCRFCGHSFDS